MNSYFKKLYHLTVCVLVMYYGTSRNRDYKTSNKKNNNNNKQHFKDKPPSSLFFLKERKKTTIYASLLSICNTPFVRKYGAMVSRRK